MPMWRDCLVLEALALDQLQQSTPWNLEPVVGGGQKGGRPRSPSNCQRWHAHSAIDLAFVRCPCVAVRSSYSNVSATLARFCLPTACLCHHRLISRKWASASPGGALVVRHLSCSMMVWKSFWTRYPEVCKELKLASGCCGSVGGRKWRRRCLEKMFSSVRSGPLHVITGQIEPVSQTSFRHNETWRHAWK